MDDILKDITEHLVSQMAQNGPLSSPQFEHESHRDRTRTGKVARLPADIRDMVNTMLYENAPYAAIIDKLAALGHPGLTPSNISRWREGGHRHWLYRRQQTEALRISSQARLDMLQKLTPEEQHSLHQALELAFSNQMLSALAHIDFNLTLSHKDAESLAKLGSAISRNFRERTRYEWLQLARKQPVDNSDGATSPPKK